MILPLNAETHDDGVHGTRGDPALAYPTEAGLEWHCSPERPWVGSCESKDRPPGMPEEAVADQALQRPARVGADLADRGDGRVHSLGSARMSGDDGVHGGDGCDGCDG